MANRVARRATEPEVIDVPAVCDDEAFIEQVSVSVQDFLGGLSKFFRRASEIELSAKATLSEARSLTAPTSMEADESIQTFVKRTTAEKKAAREHWAICQVVHGFHGRLTEARARSVLALDEANEIGNRLHVAYIEAERRRAAIEQDRIRRAAEDRARADRERELAELEAQATASEEASGDLSEREQMFLDLFYASQDATRAAHRAGFKNPIGAAARLLSRPKIQQAIKGKREAEALRQQVAAKRDAPLDVQVETVRPEISRASGASERTTWRAEVVDEGAFIDAVFAGRSGIPRDVLTVNFPKLNEYARSLQSRLDLWPGVRAVKSTKVI